MTTRPAASRAPIGILGLILVTVGGLAATYVGGITCNEDVQSPEQAPTLCSSVGSGPTLWLPTILGFFAFLLMLIGGGRARTLWLATAMIVAADGGLFLMWALVSHGSIRY
jgi:hypothetical protein